MPIRKIMNDHATDIMRNVLQWGIVTVATITSAQQEIEWWLRVSSLVLAIIASCYTIWSIHRKNKQP